MNYNTLQKEIFVYKYYLKKLIKENQGVPSFIIEIENPKKLWKNIKKEICLEKNSNKIIIMLKVLILLYKNYYQSKRKSKRDFKPFGQFKDYDFFINLYQSNDNIEIKFFYEENGEIINVVLNIDDLFISKMIAVDLG